MISSKFSKFYSNIMDIQNLSDNVKEFTISSPPNFSFIPGQYISIIMDNKEKNIKLRRPYSIISTIEENKNTNTLKLCIKILDKNIGNITPLLDKLKIGDQINAIGPLGEFKINDESLNKDLIFISTGVGIAPFLSMIPYYLAQNNKNKILLICGYRKEEDILYYDHFIDLTKKYKNFKFEIILSQPSKKYKGNIGRVNTLLQKNINKKAVYHICGLNDMISSARLFLLKNNIEGKNIFSEKYD